MSLKKSRRCQQVKQELNEQLFPVNAGNRARFHGVLNAFLRAALRFDDF
jgi:hypothetical protein